MVLSVLTFIVVVAIIGFATWLVITYVPMPEPLARVLGVVVALLVLLWAARWLLVGGYLKGV